MHPLTEGAVEKIANGIDVDKPVLQILGHKKLASSSSGERYRLLVSDGKRINSFTMLATQLNSMITDNILTEFSICEVGRYAISMVNKGGKQQRVMIILDLQVKVPGHEVGHKIGSPTNVEVNGDTESEKSASSEPPPTVYQKKNVETVVHKPRMESSGGDISTTPIIALSPYQNRWVIKARVTNKSGIRTWSNSRGEGKLFSMDLVDESGEIRCTAFRNQCDKFYDMIEVGNVYYISRCILKTANKQFSNLKNDYEMTLTNDTEIIPCHDEVSEIPEIQFNFVPISEVESREKNDILDVLGIVKSSSGVQTITSRNTGKELKKHDVNLVDDSNAMVCLTLWGQQAEDFDGQNNPVVAVKGARVGEFNGGKNLSTLSSSVLQVDPDIEAAHRLRGWFNSVGKNEDIKSMSRALGGGGGAVGGPWITFQQAKDMQLGFRGDADVYTVTACVNMIRVENALYKSCPTENCKKKLIDQDNDMYRCEKCDREFPNFKYRLIANANVSDWTGSQWVTFFNEEAEKILDITAQELGELRENDEEAFLQKFGDAAFQYYIFKIRVKMETFSDERRLRATCLSATPMDYKMHNNHMIKEVMDMLGVQKA